VAVGINPTLGAVYDLLDLIEEIPDENLRFTHRKGIMNEVNWRAIIQGLAGVKFHHRLWVFESQLKNPIELDLCFSCSQKNKFPISTYGDNYPENLTFEANQYIFVEIKTNPGKTTEDIINEFYHLLTKSKFLETTISSQPSDCKVIYLHNNKYRPEKKIQINDAKDTGVFSKLNANKKDEKLIPLYNTIKICHFNQKDVEKAAYAMR
jgi:hypothetical protein